MSATPSLWVLGHCIRPLDTDDSYGMIEVTSPPGVPGPPPHYHKRENEFFFVIKGSLDVMANGEWRRCDAGQFVDLPPGTIHTFINNTTTDVVWVTGWRPKGFERFFTEFGIPASRADAREASVSGPVVQAAVSQVEAYGMFVAASHDTGG